LGENFTHTVPFPRQLTLAGDLRVRALIGARCTATGHNTRDSLHASATREYIYLFALPNCFRQIRKLRSWTSSSLKFECGGKCTRISEGLSSWRFSLTSW